MINIKYPIITSLDVDEFKNYLQMENPRDILEYFYKAHQINYFIKDIKINFNDLDLNIIIPVRNRRDNLTCVLESLFRNTWTKNIAITLVEYDSIPQYSDIKGINYIFIPENKLYFPKSMCQNIGAIMVKSKYFLFHDADCVVNNTFLTTIEKCIELGVSVVQPYNKRRILNLNQETSKAVILGMEITNSMPGIIIPGIGSTGGSLLVKRDLFYNIGGYDSELFWDYSIEDTFFWTKLGKVIYLDDILTVDDEIYHLYHSSEKEKNIYFHSMEIMFKLLVSLNESEFQEFLQDRKKSFLECYKKLNPNNDIFDTLDSCSDI